MLKLICKKDEIPAGLESNYVEMADGNYRLQVDDTDAVKAEKKRIDEFRTNTQDARNKLSAYGGRTPEEIDAAFDELRKVRDEKAAAAGDMETLVKSKVDEVSKGYEKQLSALTKEFEAVSGSRDKYRAESRAQRLGSMLVGLEGAGPKQAAGARSDIQMHAERVFSFNDEDELVYNDPANPGKTVTLEEWRNDLPKQKPYLFEGSNAAGDGPSQHQSGPSDGAKEDDDGVVAM